MVKGEWFDLARERGRLLQRGYVGGKGRIILVLQSLAAVLGGQEACGRAGT